MFFAQNIPAAGIWAQWLFVILLSFGPFLESRGAIMFGLLAGLNPAVLFAVSTASNILAIPVAFLLISRLEAVKFLYRLLGKGIEQKMAAQKNSFEKYEEFALLLFVAAPIPGTGAWTGAFVSEALGLDRRRSIAVIAAGVIISAALVFFGAELLGEFAKRVIEGP